MIPPERVRPLASGRTKKGRYVLYWMQAAQRAKYNHALEYAIKEANDLGKPVVVYFGLQPSGTGANPRHVAFMLEGLKETAERLVERGCSFRLVRTPPLKGALDLAEEACLVVVDRGYLRGQREARAILAHTAACRVVEVETGVVVPVETASPKEEWSAATFRPKVSRHLGRFLVLPHTLRVRVPTGEADPVPSPPVLRIPFRGGRSAALARLSFFLASGLPSYAEERNDPNASVLSGMSPYLHFGQISPIEIALAVQERGDQNAAAYLEELIVRRELAANFVWYNRAYSSIASLPTWAAATLERHAGDRREYLYTERELEEGKTHDPIWNATQREMVATGTMHSYLRMYWGKKILEWSETPEKAYRTALLLNNRYEIDGRNPNGYAGVAWCFGKHDRPWKERAVFGTVRYMSAAGLRRKFDTARFVESVQGR